MSLRAYFNPTWEATFFSSHWLPPGRHDFGTTGAEGLMYPRDSFDLRIEIQQSALHGKGDFILSGISIWHLLPLQKKMQKYFGMELEMATQKSIGVTKF